MYIHTVYTVRNVHAAHTVHTVHTVHTLHTVPYMQYILYILYILSKLYILHIPFIHTYIQHCADQNLPTYVFITIAFGVFHICCDDSLCGFGFVPMLCYKLHFKCCAFQAYALGDRR